jgi:hypothetical protein
MIDVTAGGRILVGIFGGEPDNEQTLAIFTRK